MPRCVPAALLLAAVLLAAPASRAQPSPDHRVFPAHALRGELLITQPPAVMLNGQPAQLAPGVRLRNLDNLIVPAQLLADRKLAVHFTREATTGLLLEVWVLRPAELQNRPWPTTERDAQAWSFDPAAQRWTRP